jgi:MFS transporter, DHA3 family, tetracycline resistance protein
VWVRIPPAPQHNALVEPALNVRRIRSRTNPYRLYIGLEVAESFLVAIAYTTAVVYWVRSGHLNPLQLILLGTMVEAAYFVLQLPSGVLADVVSRTLCVVAGRALVAAGFLMQGRSAHFAILLTAQIPVGFGAASALARRRHGWPMRPGQPS